MSSTVFKTRSAKAVAVRRGDEAAAAAATRDLAAAKLEQYIARTIAAAPPLTDEQCDKLVAILRGGAA